MEIELFHLLVAYRKLKTIAYYENLNLFLRKRLAEYEATEILPSIGHGFSTHGQKDLATATLRKIADYADANDDVLPVLKRLLVALNAENPESENLILDLMSKVDFRLLHKGLAAAPNAASPDDSNEPLFVTNERPTKELVADKINYFVDMPIELHMIDVLWTLLVGPLLDGDLTDDCYGNRLSGQSKKFSDWNEEFSTDYVQSELFTRYIDQYNEWRDTAIETAQKVTASGKNCVIFSLDLKEYYYYININWTDVFARITNSGRSLPMQRYMTSLTKIVEKLHATFGEKITSYLQQTHPDIGRKNVLPIGLTSSSVLANWHLRKFDRYVGRMLRPSSYGRYVDDMLFVFQVPSRHRGDGKTEGGRFDSVGAFIRDYFSGVIERSGEGYKTAAKFHGLPIQKHKLLLHYFDKNFSSASLEVFKAQLEERSSAFRFLPEDEVSKEFERVAYDLLYDGSAYKFRSVIGTAENETELSKFLSSQIIAHRLCDVADDKSTIADLERFFQGKNAVQFFRLWEKLFSYGLIKNKHDFIRNIHQQFSGLISQVKFKEKGLQSKQGEHLAFDVGEKIRGDLRDFLSISIGTAFSMVSQNDSDRSQEKMEAALIFADQEAEKWRLAKCFRDSNLLRHHFVSWSLLSYSKFEGELFDRRICSANAAGLQIDSVKLALTPRFIHFDEWQCWKLLSRLHDEGGGDGRAQRDWTGDCFDSWLEEYRQLHFGENFPIRVDELSEFSEHHNQYGEFERSSPRVKKIKIDSESIGRAPKIKIAIGNMKIPMDWIARAVRLDADGPVETFARQQSLFKMLNEANREEVDMLVLPEVSVPVSWLPFMVSYARRNQVALVFGLEHWVYGGKVYNFVIEALPFKIQDTYNTCAVTIRLKNHYAPKEKRMIENFRLTVAEPRPAAHEYYLNSWRGVSFASYNCFELADISHRTLFRSKLDLLTAVVWNRDTDYYDHIMASAVRDLFCYVVQANTSQYGGSCVLQPTKSERQQIIKVKGGENDCILTTDLDLAALRDAQFKVRDGVEAFKPTPPGFDYEDVRRRKGLID